MDFSTFISQIGGPAAAATVFAPMITGKLKKLSLFRKKSRRALLSPIVGFAMTAAFGMVIGAPIEGALTLGLIGLMGGSVGSSVRDSIKHREKYPRVGRQAEIK